MKRMNSKVPNMDPWGNSAFNNNNNSNNVDLYGAVTWALPKTRAPNKVMEKKLDTSET